MTKRCVSKHKLCINLIFISIKPHFQSIEDSRRLYLFISKNKHIEIPIRLSEHALDTKYT